MEMKKNEGWGGGGGEGEKGGTKGWSRMGEERSERERR